MSILKNLKDRVKDFTILLPFMENREKGDMAGLIGTPVTIQQFGFLHDTDKAGDEKEYVCFTIKEDPKRFYFGGQVLTDQLQQLAEEGYKDEIENDGLPALFGEKKGKNGRKYTTVTFYPAADAAPGKKDK